MATPKKSSRKSVKKKTAPKKAPKRKAAAKKAPPKKAKKTAAKKAPKRKAAAKKAPAKKAAPKRKPVPKQAVAKKKAPAKKTAPKKPTLADRVTRDAAASVTHDPRAFIEGKITTDTLAEEMGEDAVRAITTGEDEEGDRDGENVAAVGGPFVVTNVFD